MGVPDERSEHDPRQDQRDRGGKGALQRTAGGDLDLAADKTGEITRRSLLFGGAAFIVGGVLATPVSRNGFGTLGWWFFNVSPPDARLGLPETIVRGDFTPELVVRG